MKKLILVYHVFIIFYIIIMYMHMEQKLRHFNTIVVMYLFFIIDFLNCVYLVLYLTAQSYFVFTQG